MFTQLPRRHLHHLLATLLLFVVFAAAPAWTAAQDAAPTLSAAVTPDGIPTLVGPDGLTLYTFAHDDDGVSTCYDACAEAWPPLIVGQDAQPTVGEGVPGQVATVARDDGSMQVTYNGWPLYYYHEDTQPGQANGQGEHSVWFAANPADIMLAHSDELGDYLVGAAGLTLYIFTHDQENESYCFDECLITWPPVLLAEGVEPTLGAGVTGELGTAQLPDGSQMLTYEGWPLYFFKGDQGPAQFNGNGVRDVWFVASPAELQRGEANVGIELVADGMTAPLALKAAPDGSGRLFVVDQAGMIWLLSADGQRQEQPFLDLRDRIVELEPDYDERGVLGLAFHPQFAENGRFFVYYSAPLSENAPEGWDHTSHISEFTVSADNPDMADPASERLLLAVDEPQSNHNAGQIEFGPDGFLYIPLGDGGGANDTDEGHTPGIGNGQDISNVLGSILRIDVDSGDPYGIPADNPFVNTDGVPPETFAFGFRNPFHISFDRQGDGRLFAADAGQELYEEVSIVTAGGNYGWNIMEGAHCFNPEAPETPPATCPDVGAQGEPLIAPVIEIDHSTGVVIVGGYVYHGASNADLQDNYVFATYTVAPTYPGGGLFVARPAADGGLWSVDEIHVTNGDEGHVGGFIRALGEDANGELYVLASQNPGPAGNTGVIYRIIAPTEATEDEGPEAGATEAVGATQEASVTQDTGAAGACSITVAGDFAVNIRSGPATTFDIAGQLTEGQTLDLAGQMQDANGMTWWQTADGNWVRSDVVTQQGDCASLPTVNP